MALGIAFQLMDDTLDYIASEEQFGKSIGHDLEEGKITLPLIHTLKRCSPEERLLIGTIVEKELLDKTDFETVIGLVQRYGGIEYTVDRARHYIDDAKQLLHVFASSPEREALLSLSEYVITRVK